MHLWQKLLYTDHYPKTENIYIMNRLYMLGTVNAQERQNQAKQHLHIKSIVKFMKHQAQDIYSEGGFR